MENIKVNMTYTKSTKRTHVYSGSDSNEPITTLYIKRDALPAKQPKNITIIVSEDNHE